MKVSELTKLTSLTPEDEVLVVRGGYGPGSATLSVEKRAASEAITNDEVVKRALLKAWPVGSYYKGEDDPNESIGGTWKEIFGRMLFAFDSGNAGDTGGAESVTLNSDMMPSHTHGLGSYSVSNYHHHAQASAHSHGHGVAAHTHTVNVSSTHTHTIPTHSHTIPTHRHALYGVNSTKAERSDLGARSGDGGFAGRLMHPETGGTKTSTAPSYPSETISTVSSKTSSSSSFKSESGATNPGATGSASPFITISDYSDLTSFSTLTSGGGFGHDNMPPNTICRIWRRDA